MLNELSKIMDFSIDGDNYFESMKNNVFGKKSEDGIKKTSMFLIQLYSFNISTKVFKAFKYYWSNCDINEKALITFIYAINNDYLLRESINVLSMSSIGSTVPIEKLMDNIVQFHPNRYTAITLRSIAKNIASSWKQAGFITGKVSNIRTNPQVTYKVVAFAMLLSFLKGDSGDFIIHSNCVKALCLSETKLRELALEASKRDYLQYQYAGNVTSISFDKLIYKIGLDAI
jgi:hypothetical protein